MGFPDNGQCGTTTAHRPDPSSPGGANIQVKHPTYYTTPNTPATKRNIRVDPRPSMVNCLVGDVSTDGNSFQATATGVIAPGRPASAPVADQDHWTMDETRQLANIQDGIRYY